MSNASDPAEKFRQILEPYIKPREHVNYIRRILALHLEFCSGDGSVKSPLSLVTSSLNTITPAEGSGILEEYTDALKANIAARNAFDELLRNRASQSASSPAARDGAASVEDHLARLKLQRKHDRLVIIKEHIESLLEKPANSQDFLKQEHIQAEGTSLPPVPKEIVNSIVAGQAHPATDLKSQANRLEKIILRAKLLLKQEERLLAQTRDRSGKSMQGGVTDVARFEALSVTRNELINWIETELSKASTDESNPNTDADADDMVRNATSIQDSQSAITSKILQIKEKYAKYVQIRKELLNMVPQAPRLPVPSSTKTPDSQDLREVDPPPADHFLIPYVESLLSIARNQRSIISLKSHINGAVSRQARDASQSLTQLAEESQLLLSQPEKDASRQRPGIDEQWTIPAGQPAMTGSVKPWVLTADSAKISTLEAVAEAVEKGQVALEGTMKMLDGVNDLVGNNTDERTGNDETETEVTENDVWLEAGPRSTPARKLSESSRGRRLDPNDVWSQLRGNLGLIGHEDAAT